MSVSDILIGFNVVYLSWPAVLCITACLYLRIPQLAPLLRILSSNLGFNCILSAIKHSKYQFILLYSHNCIRGFTIGFKRLYPRCAHSLKVNGAILHKAHYTPFVETNLVDLDELWWRHDNMNVKWFWKTTEKIWIPGALLQLSFKFWS